MRKRYDIEGDLSLVTARLHELAICGIDAGNLNDIRRLTEAVNTLVREADMYAPQIINFPADGR
jgi:hypothetical protein